MKISTTLALFVVPVALLSGCSADVRALGDVGVDSGTASCLLAETEGIMEPERLVDIVGERTSYSQAEEEVVTRAFLSCIS